jgi:hypothetical protein
MAEIKYLNGSIISIIFEYAHPLREHCLQDFRYLHEFNEAPVYYNNVMKIGSGVWDIITEYYKGFGKFQQKITKFDIIIFQHTIANRRFSIMDLMLSIHKELMQHITWEDMRNFIDLTYMFYNRHNGIHISQYAYNYKYAKAMTDINNQDPGWESYKYGLKCLHKYGDKDPVKFVKELWKIAGCGKFDVGDNIQKLNFLIKMVRGW